MNRSDMFGPPALGVGIGVLVEKLCSINYKKVKNPIGSRDGTR